MKRLTSVGSSGIIGKMVLMEVIAVRQKMSNAGTSFHGHNTLIFVWI